MRIFSWLATYLFAIALPLLIVTASVRFLVNEERVTSYGFRNNDVSNTMGLSLEELEKVSQKITSYFNDDSEFIQIYFSVNGKQDTFFRDVEIIHLRDVKTLLGIVYRLSEISLAIVLTYIATTIFIRSEHTMTDLAREVTFSIAIGAIILLGLASYVFFDFDSAWTQFHELVFANDFWLLDPSRDRLIQMYPEQFWEAATLACTALIAGQMFFIGGSAVLYLGWKRGWGFSLRKHMRRRMRSHQR